MYKTRTLAKLKPGEETVIAYQGKTDFAVWIAMQRKRLRRNFHWQKLPPASKQSYRVWLDDKGGTLEKQETLAGAITPIDWTAAKFSQRDRNRINKAIDRYRFAPRRGRGGGLIRAASRQSNVPYFKAYRWAKGAQNTRAMDNADPEFRRFLAAFVSVLNNSKEARFLEEVVQAVKGKDRVSVKLNKRLRGLVESALKARCSKYKIVFAEPGSPALYHVTGVIAASS